MLEQRFPGIPIFLSPCRVQGEQAPLEIKAAIQRLITHGQSEVIIVGRGGGSPEDLAAFSDEIVVRAVAACHIPVVSAVGHEVDISICDLVADVRAATPSHAAELVVPERTALLQHLDVLDERLLGAMRRELNKGRERLGRLKLRHPRRKVLDSRQRLNELRRQLHSGMVRQQGHARRRLELQHGRLLALSPEAVLSRGYAVVLKEGKALKESVDAGLETTLRFVWPREVWRQKSSDGVFGCTGAWQGAEA